MTVTRAALRGVRGAVPRPGGVRVARALSGAHAEVISADILQPALRHPLTESLLAEQLGRLGGTVYSLHSVAADISGEPMVPLSILGRLRHQMINFIPRAPHMRGGTLRGRSHRSFGPRRRR